MSCILALLTLACTAGSFYIVWTHISGGAFFAWVLCQALAYIFSSGYQQSRKQ